MSKAVSVRYDLSPADHESAIRDHLIAMGWTPPKEKENEMTETTTPKWGVMYHIDGYPWLVIKEEDYRGRIKLANFSGETLSCLVDRLDEYKPRTIWIGDTEVPEPLQEPPEYGEEYWVADISDGGVFSLTWKNKPIENLWLLLRIIHRTQEAASRHRSALIRVSGGKNNE